MQTLRKRTSPYKYKNEAAKFLGEGMTFKAKLIGILEVNEARGDKMCQDALNDLKTAIRAAGEHKQRITISIAIDGLRLRDEKTGDCLYHHPVHKISFIAQDMTDSRAFGYIFGSPDTGHRFFGIKTDKTASQVVVSMRDLFQVVFELKKKEIEMAKHHIEQRQIRFATTLSADTAHHSKNDYDTERVKGKHQQMGKMRYISKSTEPSPSAHKPSASEAIADLLDLEHELNNIQQGINQMDRITPSDPFGPLARPDPFSDIFEDPFASNLDTVQEMRPPLQMAPPLPYTKPRTVSQSESPTEFEKQSTIFDGASSLPTKTTYVPQFPAAAAKTEESHWFDQETESLFNEATNVMIPEPTSSPIIFPTQEKYETEQGPQEKSPLKPDVFMELDPLGSGWVKPYVDKKDFFQDLKNPQKKMLKEILPDYSNDNAQGYLVQVEAAKAGEPAAVQEQSPVRGALPSAPTDTLFQAPKESTNGAKYSKLDPFQDTDPFEKTDPFSNKNYSTESPSLFNEKSFEGVFPEASAFENVTKEKGTPFASSSIHGPLRVSLPPEKSDTNTPISLSSITSKFRNPPSSPDSIRRKNYQALRRYMDERIEQTLKSPPGDDDFYYATMPSMPVVYSPKTLGRKTYSSKKYWGDGFGKAPSPPPKPALFSIKPPPLPPKKQPQSKPPARPPSLENRHSQYDTLTDDFGRIKEHKSSGKKYKRLVTKPKIPLLPPPPPQRKIQPERSVEEKPPIEQKSSVTGITLYQLDNTGLENLAMTLGIPSESIYNMTLQELTTRLSAKNLITETKQPETFKADFESNFGKPEVARPPEYDKYAAIKEFIESENKTESGNATAKKETEVAEKPKLVEDRYAALRQLSMNPQKSENLSEDLGISVEEERSSRAENMSDGARALALDSFTPRNSLELAAESPTAVDREEKDVEGAAGIDTGAMAKIESVEKPRDIPFPQNVHKEPRDNWTAFDKISLYEAPPRAGNFRDNDNSPYSSDGKEDPFVWRKKLSQRTRTEPQWREEDESWDDYSPKSYWSEESSHDERTHDKRRDDKYQRKASEKQMRKGKGDQWSRQSKWNEETEDEYEEWYKNRRHRGGACSKERKNEMFLVDDRYDSRNKSYDDSRNISYDDSERYARWGRKKSESDDEYRRRCDSDTSDREYVWISSKRNFPEAYSPGEKNQYYVMPRDYPERCHESRSRHRKGESHKRPSSASEGKRNYEHMARGKRGSIESEQAASYQMEPCPCCPDTAPHYSSYDRRVAQGKKSSRPRRDDLEQCGMETKEKNPESYDYYKPSWQKEDGRRSRHYRFEDDFTPTTPDKAQPRLHSPTRESSKSPRRQHRQRGGRDGFFRPDNNNESFGNVGEEFGPPRVFNPQGEVDKDQASKQQIFGRSQFGPLTRQESSASLRKSESINIFSREDDPFEGDDFFSKESPPQGHKLHRFWGEKSKSNTNVSDNFAWKGVFSDSSFHE